mmetsp:Transcript_7174/g.6364  ORF Transcript_7174/g.6364 Transcript_7174/m.6364 type:complete len:180 (+) Transcript_7174:478-1017(+)
MDHVSIPNTMLGEERKFQNKLKEKLLLIKKSGLSRIPKTENFYSRNSSEMNSESGSVIEKGLFKNSLVKNCQSSSKESFPTTQNDVFKSVINTFKFKYHKNQRNYHTSYLRSKNDSLNGSENGGVFKCKFDKLQSIQDDKEQTYGQVNCLETQELLASKLEDLKEYNSCQQSIENSDKK